MVTRAGLALAVVALGCQGQSGGGGEVVTTAPHVIDARAFAADPHEVVPHDPDGSGGGVGAAGSNREPIDRGSKDLPAKPDEPEAPDPGKVIDTLGAIPAWQAVIDRADLLARRTQHGVAYGRLGAIVMVAPTGEAGFGADGGPATIHVDAGAGSGSARAPADAGLTASPYRWLIDDSDGNGALAIRVALGAKGAAAKEGDRVALGGAWVLDADHRWFWKVDAVSPLPPAAASDVKEPVVVAPGHAIANGELPSGARTISLARDNDAVYFQIVGPTPTDDADGWPVADQLGNPTFAILSLPGERPTYGAQDMRAPDEHWTLRRGQTYWVRIGKLHKHGADKPMTINARTPPIRVL